MSNVGVVWGWGGIFFLHFMLFPTFPEKKNSGNKKQNIFVFRKTLVDRDSGNLYPIYIKKQIVVLASEPVGGRSRATELPCFSRFSLMGTTLCAAPNNLCAISTKLSCIYYIAMPT